MKKYLILLFSFFIVGCQSYRELNNSAIISAIGIDKNQNDYKVSVQVVNTEKDNDEQSNLKNPTVYSATGKSITEAINDISFKSPKLLYLGHLELVIISEELAKNGVSDVIDYFFRNNDINKNFTILVSKDSLPEEILKTPTSLVNFPSGNILGSVEISSTIGGVSSDVKFIKYVDNVKEEGIEPIMTSITIVENKDNNEKNLQIDDLAIFKGNRLVGYLEKSETKGFNFITNNIKNTVITFKCSNNQYAGINISKSNTNIKTNLKNKIPEIIIDINSNGNIIENNCNMNIKNIKLESEKVIKELVNDSIKTVQEEYQSDIFGFGNIIYKKNPNYFNNLQKGNKNYFQKIKTKVNVKVNFDNRENIIEE